MQIRLSSEAAAAAKQGAGRMSVDEFLARFPEVPRDLKDEPVLAQYVDAFGPQLREARKPTPCMGTEGGDAGHRFYAVLVNDLAIYGIGLARRERTLARLAARLDEYRKHPATYACTLVPHLTPDTPRSGCSA
ncbi:MAG TPA: hypothetical protein VFL90_04595 [Methylomirabilota bacterium]|nr:hypothetical protein [Methylomirabilota bacterium]